MTLRIAEERAAGTIPWRGLMPFMVAAVVYAAVLVTAHGLLKDPDCYWHVAVGRWIMERGTFPVSDAFSFTFTGEHWIAKEWLSQVAYAAVYGLGGWPAVATLAAAAAALAFALLARWLDAVLAPQIVLILVAASFVLISPHMIARPHVLAWPVMVAFVGGIVRAVDRRAAPSWFLLPLMTLWANLHGGFTLGILLTGLAGLDAVVNAEHSRRLQTALVWLRFAILTVVAACITPYGPESMIVTWRILGMGSALTAINEWRPQDFSSIQSFEILLLVGIGWVLYKGVVLPPVRILAVLGLLHLALSASRNGELLGLLLPIFLAAPVARHYPRLAAHARDGFAAPLRLALAGLVALLLPAGYALASVTNATTAPQITPAAAVSALRAATGGRILNSYDFGGYLIANGIPTFIDGRTELYGAAFVTRYANAVTLSDLADFVKLLDEYRISATLLSPNTAAVAFLDRLPGWKRLYADDVAVVHVRQ